MPDDVEQVQPDPGEEVDDGASLQDVLSAAMDVDEQLDEGEKSEGNGADGDKGVTPEDLKALQDKVQGQEDTNTRLRTEVAILREKLSAATERPSSTTEEKDPIKEALRSVDLKELTTRLKGEDTAAQAIVDLVEAGVRAGLTSSEKSTTSRVREATELQAAFSRDQAKAQAKFGNLLANNEEFRERCLSIYEDMTKDARHAIGDVRWSPGALYNAAAAAYAELSLEGKVGTNTLSLTERKPKPANPLFGSRAPRDSVNSDVEGLHLSARDRRIIEDTCRKMEISPEKVYKQLAAERKIDKTFGG